MAFRVASRRRHMLPLAVGAVASATVSAKGRTAFAEEPTDSIRTIRKPIYDDPTPSYPPTKQTPQPTPPSKGSIVGSADKAQNDQATPPEVLPTPTDRLASHVRDARLTIHGYSASAENSLNSFMTRVLHLENDFTSTIASLAPPPQANEPLMPGFIYTLVATLAGSIVSRNRGILLRTAVPAAFGLTAAYAALPYTMHNVEGLVSRYEERFPEVQRIHGEVNEKVRYFWETGKAHSAMTLQKGEDVLEEARRKMQDWVRQGK